MKTIALFDTISHGHHPTYIRIFSKILLEMNYRVVVFCPESNELNKWIIEQQIKNAANFYTFEIKNLEIPALPLFKYMPRPANALIHWRYAASVIKKTFSYLNYSPDLVFFPWLDSYISEYLTHYIVDSIFPYNWSGLFFHPPYLLVGQKYLPVFNIPITPYAIANSKRCLSIALVDEIEAAKLQCKLDKPVIAFPDLADDSLPDLNYQLVKEIRLKAGDRKIVGSVGALSARKGVFTLLQVAQQLKEDNWFFIFVGGLDKQALRPKEISEIHRFVQSNPSNCFFHLNRIPEETQFNAVIETCDVLFAAYENFPYSSNMLAKAAIFRKPIIVSDGFLIDERVKAFRLGLSIPQRDVTKCIEALNLLAQELDSNMPLLNPDFEGYKQVHSVDKLYAAFQMICDHV